MDGAGLIRGALVELDSIESKDDCYDKSSSFFDDISCGGQQERVWVIQSCFKNY